MSKTYQAVKVSKGRGGWGGPLVIQPTDQRNKVVSVTGGGIAAAQPAVVYIHASAFQPSILRRWDKSGRWLISSKKTFMFPA